MTDTLYKKLMKTEPTQKSIDLEHRMASICREIGSNGWTFNEKKAGELYAELAQKRHVIEEDLKELFPPWEVTEDFYPKANNKTRGYVKGELFVKSKTIYFNPASRVHIQKCSSGQVQVEDQKSLLLMVRLRLTKPSWLVFRIQRLRGLLSSS